uniref:Complex III subunit VI n=1 Tax=Gossypium raimondii TaxID=29730 RepID=A0A0D2TWV3_GOSRA|nr:hypothetical protein B456_008G041200 [Gossypium raimondii]
MADEEPVDQKKYLEEGCKPKCVKQLRAYEACVKRIEGDESGHKHCTGQYFDYWACIDKCCTDSILEIEIIEGQCCVTLASCGAVLS